MMTTMPSWLYYLFGALMLVVAGYCMALLVIAVVKRRPAGRDVDVSHVFMGVSMAGMFVARWAIGPSLMWELIFAVLLIWFLVRSVQSVQHYGLHLSHSLIHALMSFAMLLMYWFPAQTVTGPSAGSMSMSSAGPRLDPGLGFVIAFILFTSAIFTLASPHKGASHHGNHVPVYARSGASESGSRGSRPEERTMSVGRIEGLVAAPWLEDSSHVVMCVAMGFMLVLLL
jgi:Domain of unknown function (DUF5134)